MAKKIPMRQCVGCREMKPKNQMIRIVRSPEGEISLDFRGKAPGRGVYVCPNADCFAKMRKSRGAERSLETQIPDAVYEALEERLKEYEC